MHLVELIQQPPPMPKHWMTSKPSPPPLWVKALCAQKTHRTSSPTVGVFSILAVMAEAEKFGLSFDVVDDLTSKKLGRAKSATFRTADVVGLDTMAHVIKTMDDNLKDDPFSQCVVLAHLPCSRAWLKKAHWVKNQVRVFIKKGKEIKVLNPATGEYVTGGGTADDIIARILKHFLQPNV